MPPAADGGRDAGHRLRVEPDPDRMAAAGIGWTQLTGALQAASVRQAAGTAVRDNREIRVEVGPLFRGSEEIGRVDGLGERQARAVWAFFHEPGGPVAAAEAALDAALAAEGPGPPQPPPLPGGGN